MSPISMLPLHEDDLEFLRRLRNDVRQWLGTKSEITPEMQRQWYFNTYADDASWLIFIAFDAENQPVGYGQIRGHDDDSFEIGCAVRPEHWHKGYGSAIVEWLLLYLTSNLKTRNIWLWLYDDNKSAVNLYLKAGFKVTSHLGDGKLRMDLQ